MNESIRKDVETAADILRKMGAKEVYLFGSAARGVDVPESDIDLAVKGLPPEVFYEAVGSVIMAVSRDVDVVDLDEQNLFTEYLQEKGELVRVA